MNKPAKVRRRRHNALPARNTSPLAPARGNNVAIVYPQGPLDARRRREGRRHRAAQRERAAPRGADRMLETTSPVRGTRIYINGAQINARSFTIDRNQEWLRLTDAYSGKTEIINGLSGPTIMKLELIVDELTIFSEDPYGPYMG